MRYRHAIFSPGMIAATDGYASAYYQRHHQGCWNFMVKAADLRSQLQPSHKTPEGFPIDLPHEADHAEWRLNTPRFIRARWETAQLMGEPRKVGVDAMLKLTRSTSARHLRWHGHLIHVEILRRALSPIKAKVVMSWWTETAVAILDDASEVHILAGLAKPRADVPSKRVGVRI
jgi:hypothetical protein